MVKIKIKPNIIFTLFLLVFLLIAFLSIGCTKSSSPEALIKAVLDSAIKKDYSKTFTYFIDINGNSISEQSKQGFKDSLGPSPMSYRIKEVTGVSFQEPIKESERGFVEDLKKFEDVKLIFFTVTGENQQTEEKMYYAVKYQGKWKILLG